MATTTVTTRGYPKRKRAEISYHESSSDEGEGDDEYGVPAKEMAAKTNKKLKASHTNLSTKPLPKRKIFPFTSLPAELKNQIYAFALTDENGIYLISRTKRHRRTVQRSASAASNSSSASYRRHRSQLYPHSGSSSWSSANTPLPALTPNILLLNRAIYAETQPILYADNTFALEDTSAMYAFLATIGPKNRATLTDLTIKGWGHTKVHKALNHPAFTMLAGAVNLRRLHLDCVIAWGGPKSVAKQLYCDGINWLETVGAAKGNFDAAIELIDIPDGSLDLELRTWAPNPSMTTEDKLEEFRAELRKWLH